MATAEKSFSHKTKRRGIFIPWRWLIIAAVIAALIALIVIATRKTPLERGMASLVEAFSKRRVIEPRLSGGFKAAPLNTDVEDLSNINQAELERARELITDALADGDTKANQAYGSFFLSQGIRSADALKYLRAAVALMPESAEARNDLGVCLMVRNQVEDALYEFDLALKANPQMPEAIFNRGLCYRRLELRDAASADLSQLLQSERDKGWSNEVRQKLEEASAVIPEALTDDKLIEKLDAAMEAGDLETARNLLRFNFDGINRHLLAVWEKYLSDPSKAEQALSRVSSISELAAGVNGDNTIATTLEHMRGMPDEDKPTELEALQQFRQSLKLIGGVNNKEALPILEQARKNYAAVGNELFRIRAGYAIGRCQYNELNFASSIETLKANLDSIRRNGWAFDESRTLLLIGQAYYRIGQDSTALRYFNQALQGFRKLNETEAKPFQSIGGAYWHLGDLDAALEFFRSSNGIYLQSDPKPGELVYNYLTVADIYRIIERHKLARLYAEQALHISEKLKAISNSQYNNRVAQASSLIAISHANLGEFDRANAALEQAFEFIGNLIDSDRKFTEPLVLSRAGDAARLRGDYAAAIDYYTKAETLLAGEGADKILQINTLRGRAEAKAKSGDMENARLDLQLAIGVIEGYRENLQNRGHRMDFLAASSRVFDEMIALDASEPGLAAQAFETSERSRARALLDDISSPTINPTDKEGRLVLDADSALMAAMFSLNRSPSPSKVEQIKDGLPEDVTLIEYSVTSEKAFAFLIDRSRFELIPLPVSSSELSRMVGDYVSDVTHKAAIGDLSQKARELHRLLIEPVESKIAKERTICIVPDKSLHFLPFAALKDSEERYLIESYKLIYAPSASVLIECLKQRQAKESAGEERLLAVGNPQFNRDEFARLSDLTEAEREATESARFYDNPEVLTGANATEEAMRRAMRECDVAHLALHCLVDQESPWTAALVLASAKDSRAPLQSEGEALRGASQEAAGKDRGARATTAEQIESDDPHDGLLYLREVYGLALPRARLVVLSACETGLGQFYRGEGVVSLIHPFIAARVSTVVASLWPVESEETSNLMIEFHRTRRESKLRASDALRASQRKMIDSGVSHPYYWAPFIVVGGNY